ncbi:MAG: hypothetical protein ABR562_04595 [Thermoplasmatota archaeon]|nr:hypothetical protein [Halobacteriales archaeon]
MALRHVVGCLLATALLFGLTPAAATIDPGVVGNGCVLRSHYHVGNADIYTVFPDMVCVVTDYQSGTGLSYTGIDVLGYVGLVNLHVNVGPTLDLTVLGFGTTSPCDLYPIVSGVTCTSNGPATAVYKVSRSDALLCTVKVSLTVYSYENDESQPHWGAQNVPAAGPC